METVPLGQSVGRAWLRLFGVIPFDYDRILILELEPGRRFLERSTMLSMRVWEHERTLKPVEGGTEIHDRIVFEPRLPFGPLAALLAHGVWMRSFATGNGGFVSTSRVTRSCASRM